MSHPAVEAARRVLNNEVARDLRENGYVSECNELVNQASIYVVLAMREAYGKVWLGSVNRYTDDDRPWLWEYETYPLYTFSCSFVVPVEDAELVRMLQERYDAHQIQGDYERIKAIHARIGAIDGQLLIWS